MAFLDFAVRFKESQVQALRNTFDRAIGAISFVFQRKRIERLILRIHKDRFEPIGTNRRAQTSPDGIPWVPISDVTLFRRTQNKRKDQALVDTGSLRDSLQIIRGNLAQALRSGTGKAVVGIPRASPNYEIGVLMNAGGENEEGFEVPARPFMGIGDDDLRELDEIIGRAARRIF